jgi:hypothetical protein
MFYAVKFGAVGRLQELAFRDSASAGMQAKTAARKIRSNPECPLESGCFSKRTHHLSENKMLINKSL